MKRYLLFDAGCSLCHDVAARIEDEAGGWLRARALDDPEMRALVERHRPGGGRRPMLVVDDGSGGVTVSTGLAMSTRLVRGLGVRRATAVARLVNDVGRTAAQESRRGFFRASGSGVLLLAGLTVGLPAAAGAVAADPTLTGTARENVLKRARAEVRYRRALATAAKQGYSGKQAEHVAIALDDGGTLLMSFLGHDTDARTRSCVVSMERDAGGAARVTLEEVEGDPTQAADAPSLGEAGLRISSLAVDGTEAAGVQAKGKVDYFKCIAFCVGANCGAKAVKCKRLIFMYAVLACMVAICGSKVKTCHKVCKKQW